MNDPERRHGLEAAEAEYDRLLRAYPALGYDVFILPNISVVERADFIARALVKEVILLRAKVTRDVA
jgi:predicted ATPase